jgi:hypothetical protein
MGHGRFNRRAASSSSDWNYWCPSGIRIEPTWPDPLLAGIRLRLKRSVDEPIHRTFNEVVNEENELEGLATFGGYRVFV